MDADQLKQLMDHQMKMVEEMIKGMSTANAQMVALAVTRATAAANVPAQSSQVPLPSPLVLEGDMEENMDFFEKSWNNYVKATRMDKWPATDDQQKVSFLLSVIGEQARKKFFNFELTADQSATPEDALTAIRAKVTPKRNIILDRLEFFSATQTSRETTDDFLTRLKTLAQMSKLGDQTNSLVTYKLVTANKWPQIRSKMLAIPDITLDKAVDMCRAEEITARRSLELAMLPPESDVKKIGRKKVQSKAKQFRCKFCGDAHEFVKGACPAFGKKCNRCKGRNHFEKVCKQKSKPSRKSSKRVKEIKDDSSGTEEYSSHDDASSEDSEEEEYEIGKIFDDSDRGGSVSARAGSEVEQKVEENRM